MFNKIFQTDVAGQFNFETLSIELTSISKEFIFHNNDLLASAKEKFINTQPLSFDEYECLSKILPVYFHEYTHFIDTTSTLWGFNFLSLMNDAYSTNKIYGIYAEGDLLKAKKFYQYVKSIKYSSYYTEIKTDCANTFPWRYRPSMGLRFNEAGQISDYPILFMRFLNYENEFLVRSPVSIVSILEVSALSQDILTQLNLIACLNEEEQLIERRLYLQKLESMLIYNPKYTEYSVCAHIVSTHFNESSIIKTFQSCAILSRMVLNFPKKAFIKISIDADIASILQLPEEHETTIRFLKGIKQFDIGILFYVMCKAIDPVADVSSFDLLLNEIYNALIRLTVPKDLLID